LDITLDQVKSFLDSDPEGQKFIQSVTDAKVTQGIKTWQTNNLENLLTQRLEQEISKRYPAETEEQKRLRALEQELANEKQTRIRAELHSRAVTEATKKGLPTGILDHFIGADEDQTAQNIAKLEAVWKSEVQREVEARFAAGGRAPVVTRPDDQQRTFTREGIARMSQEEHNRLWPEISKALAEGRVK